MIGSPHNEGMPPIHKVNTMRLFQNSAVYPAYRRRLSELTQYSHTFQERKDTFLADRFGACHFLKPVLEGDVSAFFTNGDDIDLQKAWAKEAGMPKNTPLSRILLAQIESHSTEIFYNLDPINYDSNFIKRLPGCVKHSIAWRAAPSSDKDFGAYDRVVCNFPSILRSYEAKGWKSAYMFPAVDPVMDRYAANTVRPIDIVFVGGYTRHHRQRAKLLDAVAAMGKTKRVEFYLDRSRMTRWAESGIGRILPIRDHRRPDAIREISREPIFGLSLYEAFSRAKIVLNGAVDMAGEDRGNMRCFEAMGCGALMVSDDGNYPPGMESGRTMLTYSRTNQAESVTTVLEQALLEGEHSYNVSRAAGDMVRRLYSKAAQWTQFQKLVETL